MSNEGKQLLPCERIKFIQAGEEKAQRAFVVALKYLIRGCEKARGRHFSEAESKRATGNSHETQHREL